jgi:hypothetical protein
MANCCCCLDCHYHQGGLNLTPPQSHPTTTVGAPLAQREAGSEACKLVLPWHPSHGERKAKMDASCQWKYFVLLYYLSAWRTVLNSDGPSATRQECHILLKRKSPTNQAYTEQKFSNLCRASLLWRTDPQQHCLGIELLVT